jgi:hypothetical protein
MEDRIDLQIFVDIKGAPFAPVAAALVAADHYGMARLGGADADWQAHVAANGQEELFLATGA